MSRIRTTQFLILTAAALIVLVWASGLLDPQPVAADDATYYLDCPTTQVREGENVDVFLVRVTNHKHTTKYWANWYTDAGTADETDYVHQSSDRVWTTDAEAEADRDRRVFRTRSDNQVEEDETFTARFGPDDDIVDLDDPDWDNKCEITILDDDPNIRNVEVTSEPARDSNTYGVGEVIEISATFSTRVKVAEGGNPRLGLWVGDNWKQAKYLRGSGSRVLVFGYTVNAEDEDTDGIRMGGGYKDRNGSWHNFPGYDAITHQSSDQVVYRVYEGFDDDADHKVDGSLAPVSTNVEITSSPESGDTYRYGENIEVSITFSVPLDVEGSRYINMRLGPNDDTVWRGPRYSRGSGTDTMVFAYTVRPADLDPDGVAIENTVVHSDGEVTGLGGDGTITIAGTDTEVYPRFSNLWPGQPGHKVDGRPYITEFTLTSTPAASSDTYGRGEIIQLSVNFGQNVTAGDDVFAVLTFGAGQRHPPYSSGNGSDTLVFEYTVVEGDSDDDGIGAFLTYGQDIKATGTQIDYLPDPGGELSSMDENSDHKVDASLVSQDTIAPELTSVAFSSEPPDEPGDTYIRDNWVEVRAWFNESVVVTGNPILEMDIGGSAGQATYQRTGVYYTDGPSIPRQWVDFHYRVREGDSDDDGISIGASAITLNGGTIQDEAGNDAVLTHEAVSDDPDHKVDAPDVTGPKIFSIAITSDPGVDDTYGVGDVIKVTATYNEEVTVTGTPAVQIDFQVNGGLASYSETDGTDVVFTYTVASGDTAPNGISIGADSLKLGQNATIRDAADNDATLTHEEVGVQSGHKIDTVSPTVSSVTITSDPGDDDTYGNGDSIEVSVTFSENVTVTGTPQLEIDVGGTVKTASYSSTDGSTVVFSYIVVVGDTDSDGIAIGENKLSLNGGTINDAHGNAATLVHSAVDANAGHLVDAPGGL